MTKAPKGAALFTYGQAARFLNISERMLRRLKASGTIPFYKFGHRTIRFKRADLRAYASLTKR